MAKTAVFDSIFNLSLDLSSNMTDGRNLFNILTQRCLVRTLRKPQKCQEQIDLSGFVANELSAFTKPIPMRSAFSSLAYASSETLIALLVNVSNLVATPAGSCMDFIGHI
jgi:hypothetical protein